MAFPTFRKYKNEKNYFKITSMSTMQELKLLGGKYYQIIDFEVTIHPDRVMIHDLVTDYAQFADEITEDEYEAKLDWCISNLQSFEL